MGCGGDNSLQRLTAASNLIQHFKVTPYHTAEADTSKGHTSLNISRMKKLKICRPEICKMRGKNITK